MIDLQGQLAANNGIRAEKMVGNIIEGFGGTIINFSSLENFNYAGEKTLLIRNTPYINMFGKKGRGDYFLISDDIGYPISIEVRSQHVAGSVNEKIPALFGNCKCLGTTDVIIVLEGEGVCPFALNWLKTKAKEETNFDIQVMNLSEFYNYMHKLFTKKSINKKSKAHNK